MPIVAYFGVVGFALMALLFVADATLERSSPVIVTSNRIGLPKPWRPDTVQTLVTAPAPAPDMTSQAVLAVQPKSEPKAPERTEPVARAAQAAAPSERNRVRPPIDHPQKRLVDGPSIEGQQGQGPD